MSVLTREVTLKTFVVMLGPDGSGKSGLSTTVVLRNAPSTPWVRLPFFCNDMHQREGGPLAARWARRTG